MLPYAEADMVELAKVLLAGGYRPDNVVLMTQRAGAENTRLLPESGRIRKELQLLLAERARDDTVLIAFAGHGVQFRGEQENYFCPADARLSDKHTLIALSEVYRDLGTCEAGLKVLLVDACRNDPQSDNSRARSEVNLQSVTRPQEQEPPGGVVALFSCSAGQKAYEHSALKHGVFFHFVIDGLRGAAAPAGSSDVAMDDLAVFVKRRVTDFVRAKYGVLQIPVWKGTSTGLVALTRVQPAAASRSTRLSALADKASPLTKSASSGEERPKMQNPADNSPNNPTRNPYTNRHSTETAPSSPLRTIRADGTAVAAHYAQSNELLWKTPIGAQVQCVTTARDGRVAFGASKLGPFALDAGTGKMLWKTSFPRSIDSQQVSLAISPGGNLLCALCSTALQVYDSRNGKLIWSRHSPQDSLFQQAYFSTDGNSLLARTTQGVLTLSAQTGTER
jgi:uncharacterized caspase-like protein